MHLLTPKKSFLMGVRVCVCKGRGWCLCAPILHQLDDCLLRFLLDYFDFAMIIKSDFSLATECLNLVQVKYIHSNGLNWY